MAPRNTGMWQHVLARTLLVKTYKHGITIAVSVWALYVFTEYRLPVGWLLYLLPFASLIVGIAGVVAFLQDLLGPDRHDMKIGPFLSKVEWGMNAMVRVLVYGALFVFANAKLDTTPTVDQETVLRTITGVRLNWTERLPSLVSTIDSTGLDYARLYPNDHEYLLWVGTSLGFAQRYTESIKILNDLIVRHPSYEVHQQLGWSLNWSGQSQRASEVLERSIALDPENFEAYYHLGYVYMDMAVNEKALASFKAVLTRLPHFPEVQSKIAQLEPIVARERSLLSRAKNRSGPGTSSSQ